jgi:hypothetical protein
MHLRQSEFEDYTLAADVSCARSLFELFDLASAHKWFEDGGIGVYSNPPFLHLDVRGITGTKPPARWGEIAGRRVSHIEALDDAIARERSGGRRG